jgi:xanthine dehydrogenase accessory factor
MVRSQPLPQITSPQTAVPEHLWIAGDTPVSRALARLAETVNFHVCFFPRPQDVLTSNVFNAFPAVATSAIILLDSIEDQASVLSHWINFPLVFLGVSGSRERRAELLSRLQKNGGTREQLERIHCPVGLPIGAASAEEGAIGIVAHLIQNRSDRRISHEAASRIKSPSLIKARA